jgi:universal stress protein family protein
LRSAEENSCDLLVIGTQGIYRGVRHIVIGSDSEKVLLSTHCPELAIGKHMMAGIALDLRIAGVLIITDSRCEDHDPLLHGLSLWKEFGIAINLMYVRQKAKPPTRFWTTDSQGSAEILLKASK